MPARLHAPVEDRAGGSTAWRSGPRGSEHVLRGQRARRIVQDIERRRYLVPSRWAPPTRAWDVAAAPDGLTVYATSFYDGRRSSLAGIQVSKNAGSTWTHPAITPPAGCDADRAAQPSAFGIALRPGTNEALAGTNCGIARTTDGGNTWVQFDPTPTNGVDPNNVWDLVALPGGQTYACGADGLLSSPNGQPTTWTTPVSNMTLGGFCSLAVSPDEPNVVFAAIAANSFRELFNSFGSQFFEGVVTFAAGTATGVTWTAIPHPDGTKPKNRVSFVVTNDRSGPAFDLWLGEGDFWRAPCTAGSSPVLHTGSKSWEHQLERSVHCRTA